MAAQQQQQQQQQQSKQHNMFKLPVELQNMVNYYTPTKDILQSREAQEMLMGMDIHFFFSLILQKNNTSNVLKLGIKRGEVLLHHLVEQWKKTSSNQSRYRETLICLMKVFQHSNSTC